MTARAHLGRGLFIVGPFLAALNGPGLNSLAFQYLRRSRWADYAALQNAGIGHSQFWPHQLSHGAAFQLLLVSVANLAPPCVHFTRIQRPLRAAIRLSIRDKSFVNQQAFAISIFYPIELQAYVRPAQFHYANLR
jgi:hypothetical protein